MMIKIDPQSRIPIYEQIYNGIIELAAQGLIHPGDKLPSVRDVSKSNSVNPNTVSKAFAVLEKDGIIYSVPGRGTFLAEGHGDVIFKNAVNEFRSAAQKAYRSGLSEDDMMNIVRETAQRPES